MKTRHFLLIGLLATLVSHAEIQSIDEGGLEVVLEDVLPERESAVLLLYAPWDQASLQLKEELESWADQYSNIKVVLINVVDARTAAYRQFSLTELPAIIVYNRDQERVGSSVQSIDDLNELLRQNGLN